MKILTHDQIRASWMEQARHGQIHRWWAAVYGAETGATFHSLLAAGAS